jgi:hypothetical protein
MTAIYGWDLSHYDSPGSGGAVGEGFLFFTHKAGGDANDAELAAWWNIMKPYRDRVLLGAYWVQYPGSPSSRADAFIARLDSQCPGWRDGPFILQVDCEIWGGDTSTKPGVADIRTFCNRLRLHMPRLMPIVYAPKWAYGNSLAGLGYPLWASSYVSGAGSASKLYPGDNAAGWNAYSGQTPLILQFTSSATIAGQTTCDANAFRGSFAQLQTMLAPGWVTENGVDDMPLTSADLDAISGVVREVIGDGNFAVKNPGTATQPQIFVMQALRNIVGDPDVTRATLAAHSQLLAALVAYAKNEAAEIPPTAQAIADAFLADMNGLSPQDAARALASVMTPAALVSLLAALQELVSNPPARAVDEPADTDIFTQTQRGIAQQRIQNPGDQE